MLSSPKKIINAIGWTTGSYAVSVFIRFGTSIILTRLLSPEIFGTVLLINVIRIGIDLLSDVGIVQNVVTNQRGEDSRFLSTIWIIQALRGLTLGFIAFSMSYIISDYFKLDPIFLQMSGGMLVIIGLQSLSVHVMTRKMLVGRVQIFELCMELFASFVIISFVVYSPTIMSVLLAYILSAFFRTTATYFLPDAWHGFSFSRPDAIEIIDFGKWIFLSSAMTFLSANFDRLYLGYQLPLAVFGVFGIARSIAELPATLFLRIGYGFIFPLISSGRALPREEIWRNVAGIRFKLLLVTAVGLGAATVLSDFVVLAIYDKRYAEVGWMVPLLLAGVWVTVLTWLAEYTLLGVSKPSYAVVGNLGKLALLILLLGNIFENLPIVALVAVVAVSDLPKYAVFLFALRRERLSFLRQDMYATMAFLFTAFLVNALRWELGFGTVLQRFP